jgi:hypothetical protein
MFVFHVRKIHEWVIYLPICETDFFSEELKALAYVSGTNEKSWLTLVKTSYDSYNLIFSFNQIKQNK